MKTYCLWQLFLPLSEYFSKVTRPLAKYILNKMLYLMVILAGVQGILYDPRFGPTMISKKV